MLKMLHGLPEPLQEALERQILEALREADELHKGPNPMHDLECMKICAKIHAIMNTIRKFKEALESTS